MNYSQPRPRPGKSSYTLRSHCLLRDGPILFNTDSYFHFVDRLATLGINVPVIPGVMPITMVIKLARFSELSGAELPRWICKILESYGGNKAALRQPGEEVVTNMCVKLVAAGVYACIFIP